jgi:hypothetical protein
MFCRLLSDAVRAARHVAAARSHSGTRSTFLCLVFALVHSSSIHPSSTLLPSHCFTMSLNRCRWLHIARTRCRSPTCISVRESDSPWFVVVVVVVVVVVSNDMLVKRSETIVVFRRFSERWYFDERHCWWCSSMGTDNERSFGHCADRSSLAAIDYRQVRIRNSFRNGEARVLSMMIKRREKSGHNPPTQPFHRAK